MINIWMKPRWRDIQDTYNRSTPGRWYIDADGTQ